MTRTPLPTPAELVATIAATQRALVHTLAHAHRVYTDIADGDLTPGTGSNDRIRTSGHPTSHPEAGATRPRSQADREAAEWRDLYRTLAIGLPRLAQLADNVANTAHRREPDTLCPHWTNGTADTAPHPCVDPDTGQRTIVPAGATHCPRCQRDTRIRVCVSCEPGADHIPPGAKQLLSHERFAPVNVERYDGSIREENVPWPLCRSCYDFERYRRRNKGAA